MNIILADFYWRKLLPLTFAKPLAHLLIGIDPISDKWERAMGAPISMLTPGYLAGKFPYTQAESNLLINSAVIPDNNLIKALRELRINEVLTHEGRLIAAVCGLEKLASLPAQIEEGREISFSEFGTEKFFNSSTTIIEKPADIFTHNDAILRQDFTDLTKGLRTTDFPNHVTVAGHDVFIHHSAKVAPCIINAQTGPVYIGPDSEVMEGVCIRGPFALGEKSVVKMGAKIYGATSVGKACRIGGEVSNAVVNSYSNKGHDGFLGNAVVGSWCNLGADTNTSNLKNTYAPVKVWSYASDEEVQTELLFHGLIMGDHSKAGINSMFNTASVVGMCANIFDGGFPRRFVPSFSWGSGQSFETFRMDKALEAAQAMMARRDQVLSEADKAIFKWVFEHDSTYRKP